MVINGLTKYVDPFSALDSLLDNWSYPVSRRNPSSFSVDVQDTKDSIILTADVPGVKKENLDITAENGVLTIACQNSNEKVTEDSRYYLKERYFGSNKRSFRLSDEIDTKSIDAVLEHGVLTVTMKKMKPQENKYSVTVRNA